MSEFYVIINEAQPLGSQNPLSEVLSTGYKNSQAALDALSEIGREHGVSMDDDDATLSLPVEGTHLEYDEYYIQEIYVED